MIKGPLAVQLMDFSNNVGFILAKGQLKNLSASDVVPVLDSVISILDEVLKEPSFSREHGPLMFEYGVAKSRREMLSGNSLNVIKGDEKQDIMERAQRWYNLIYKQLGSRLFSTLSEDSVTKLFPRGLTNKIDSETIDDIQDGIWCLIYSLPTPGAMILFRVAERELRKYVRLVAGEPVNGWTDNVRKLEQSERADRSITKEFDWLKEKRNAAEHPDKRYTQEEAEEILHRISGLVKAIYARKEKS